MFTYFHFAADEELTQAMIKRRCICIAYETVVGSHNSLPLLTPMSEVAGRMAVQQGAKYVERAQGGRGILLGGVPGVAPATVLVLGGGVVGTHAAQMACGLGAKVYLLDTNLDRLRHPLRSHFSELLPDDVFTGSRWELVQQADVVIGAVLLRGAKYPQTGYPRDA